MNIFRSNKLLFLLGAIALIGFCLYEIKDEELRVANVNPKVLYRQSNVRQNGECSNTTINPFSTEAPCPSSLRNKSLFPHASMDAEIDKLVAGDKSKLEVYFEYSLRCRVIFAGQANLQQSCDPNILEENDARVLRFLENLAEKGDVQAQVFAAKIWYLEALSPAAGDSVAAGGEVWKPKSQASFNELPAAEANTFDLMQLLPGGSEFWRASEHSAATIHAVRKAAYFFLTAKEENVEADRAVFQLATFGVPFPILPTIIKPYQLDS